MVYLNAIIRGNVPWVIIGTLDGEPTTRSENDDGGNHNKDNGNGTQHD